MPLPGGGRIEVVLWSERTQTFHPNAFTNTGGAALAHTRVRAARPSRAFLIVYA